MRQKCDYCSERFLMHQHIVSSKKFGGEMIEVPGDGAGTYGRQIPNPVLGHWAGFS